MAHPLDGYVDALGRRGEWIVFKYVNGIKLYYVGFGEYADDRDAAIRYGGKQRWGNSELA